MMVPGAGSPRPTRPARRTQAGTPMPVPRCGPPRDLETRAGTAGGTFLEERAAVIDRGQGVRADTHVVATSWARVS